MPITVAVHTRVTMYVVSATAPDQILANVDVENIERQLCVVVPVIEKQNIS